MVSQSKTPLLTKAEGYEIGVRSALTPQLSGAAALFVFGLASEATFDGDSAGTSVGRPSRRTGIELSGSYAPLSWLTLTGDFAFTRARFTDADDGSADVWPGHPGGYVPEAAKINTAKGTASPQVVSVSSSANGHDYYNGVRTPLSLDKEAPIHLAPCLKGTVVSVPMLGGLHHRQVRV